MKKSYVTADEIKYSYGEEPAWIRLLQELSPAEAMRNIKWASEKRSYTLGLVGEQRSLFPNQARELSIANKVLQTPEDELILVVLEVKQRLLVQGRTYRKSN